MTPISDNCPAFFFVIGSVAICRTLKTSGKLRVRAYIIALSAILFGLTNIFLIKNTMYVLMLYFGVILILWRPWNKQSNKL